jgi:hypothetical protein
MSKNAERRSTASSSRASALAIDVHLLHPVAQAVHHQLDGAGVPHVQRVPAAGEVLVASRVTGLRPVVGLVVDAAERQRRPEFAAFGGVVVDHIEDDLDALAVQHPHHRLELAQQAERVDEAAVPRVGGEERERGVAPVVRQAALVQVPLGEVAVHRHELDRGDAEALEVRDDRVRADGPVGPPPLVRDIGVLHGEAADMGLVDDRAVPRDVGRPVVAPREAGVGDHRQRGDRRVVAGVEREVGGRVADAVAVQLVAPARQAADELRVRVEQDLVRVEAAAAGRGVLAVHAEAVELSRPDEWQVAVPDLVGPVGQLDAGELLAVGR